MSYDVEARPSRSRVGLWIAILAVFLILGGLASISAFNAVRDFVRDLPLDLPSQPAAPAGTPGAASPIVVPEWDGVERVNILLLGIDEREVEAGPWRTDTMILLTIDPAAKSAGRRA